MILGLRENPDHRLELFRRVSEAGGSIFLYCPAITLFRNQSEENA